MSGIQTPSQCEPASHWLSRVQAPWQGGRVCDVMPLQNTEGNAAQVSASVMVPQPVSSWMAAWVPQTLPVQMASERVP